MSKDPRTCVVPAKEDVCQSICRDFILYKPPEDNPHGFFDDLNKKNYAKLCKNQKKYNRVFSVFSGYKPFTIFAQ